MVALPTPVNLEAGFKQQYAAFLAQGFTPLIAALKIWPNNNGYCMKIADTWGRDPEVLALVGSAKEVLNPPKKPPTKEELAVELHGRAQQMEDDEYVKATRLVAEMLGHMPKASDASTVINNNVTQSVLVVKDHGSDDDWERKARAQQAKLIEHAST